MRRTKIVCTIGPASQSRSVLRKLIKAGMNVARLNMSHGNHASHRKVIRTVRQLEKETGIPVAILADLQGPRLRTGKLKNKIVILKRGDILTITPDAVPGTRDLISTDYKRLHRDVKKGSRILIDNGFIELKVLKTSGRKVICEVVEGGFLGENKGMNLPGVKLSTPTITSKDKKDLRFAVREKVDFIGVSFVRSASDVLLVKKAGVPAIAKIEKPEAVERIDEIIDASDGIMVARGDLGVEMSTESVPVIQKDIISRCNRKGRVVITATQMLESMVSRQRPTRAEASDVANAVFDGTDALMLSEEVAIGKFPVRAVSVMSRIAGEAERKIISEKNMVEILALKGVNVASAVGHAAASLAEDLNARAIAVFTASGSTALLISKYRPDAPIYTFTSSLDVARKTCLFWGTRPVMVANFSSTDQMFACAEKTLKKMKAARKGDVILTIAGVPLKKPGITNLVKIQNIGE